MPSVLSTMLTDYRVLLATTPASLTNLPENWDPQDLPGGVLNKTFVLRVAESGELMDLHGGGSLVQYRSVVEVECNWDPTLDVEAIHNTIADDIENINQTMLDPDNRGTNLILITALGGPVERISPNWFQWVGRYQVIHRESQTL